MRQKPPNRINTQYKHLNIKYSSISVLIVPTMCKGCFFLSGHISISRSKQISQLDFEWEKQYFFAKD